MGFRRLKSLDKQLSCARKVGKIDVRFTAEGSGEVTFIIIEGLQWAS